MIHGNSIKRRLLISAAVLFLLVGAASALLYLAERQYSFNLERSSHAQHVYSSYLEVSDHTYRKLSAMGQIVEEGTLVNLEERYRNEKALRQALKQVRAGIVAELTHVGDVREADELEHFNNIETLAEEIINASAMVKTAVENGQDVQAREALGQLRSQEIAGQFNRLIDQALSEELREVRETGRVAQELNALLTRILPVLMLFFLGVSAILFVTTWRALTRSLTVFEQAATAYQGGDFTYRITGQVDREFAGLSGALNGMAEEIDLQRERERVTQENLESIISSRTKELKLSNQKLERISEARKQFLADISHELRTPLTIVQGEADIALRGEPKTTEQYIEALKRVKEQAMHTGQLVQELLFVARAEVGQAAISRRPTPMVPLVVEICDSFDVIAQEKSVEIVKTHPETELIANVDAGRIKQVVTVLLDNAIRYSYEASTVDVCITDDGDDVIVQIQDQGIGVKEDEASQIFSRFYRGSNGASKSAGTGLGLPVAKAIVDAHGGRIQLDGKPGKGTTATVSLPRQPVQV